MKPYDKLTIVRNRARTRDLRMFRERVEAYFEQFEYEDDNLPMDWVGARAARSQINQMLPRVLHIVQAADMGTSRASSDGHVPSTRATEVLQNIFSARYRERGCQEILDVIDMALGLYEATRFNAWARTLNPFHYVLSALGWVAGIPRRSFLALGFASGRAPGQRVTSEDIARLEAVASRLASTEDSMERRFSELRDWSQQQFAAHSHQVEELAERLDFAERILAQPRPIERLEAPEDHRVATPDP